MQFFVQFLIRTFQTTEHIVVVNEDSDLTL